MEETRGTFNGMEQTTAQDTSGLCLGILCVTTRTGAFAAPGKLIRDPQVKDANLERDLTAILLFFSVPVNTVIEKRRSGSVVLRSGLWLCSIAVG
ncbi:uncharacterized protein RBU33_010373 isoform 2-T3 [Hipposideros larvatus]